MSSTELDRLFSKKQDEIVETMGYIDKARELLEPVFIGGVPPAKKRRVPAAVAAGALVAASILWMLLTPTAIEATVKGTGRTLEVGSWVSSGNDEGLLIAFSDGSKADIDRNSEVRLQRLKKTGAHLLLERGRVAMSVVHREDTDWRLDVGPYHIDITGTRFSADWIPEEKAFNVAVQDGTVIVEGPMLTGGKALSTGDKIYASLNDNVVKIKKKDTYEKIVSRLQEGDGVEDAPIQRTSETASMDARKEPAILDAEPMKTRVSGGLLHGESWSALAARGNYAEAVTLAERTGFKAIMTSASLKDLMLLGDAARLAKKHARAIMVYKIVRRRFAHTPEAERATFTLGRIAFETYGKYREAADWFSSCYRENPSGTIAREAAGRLMEALDKSGDIQGAKVAARQYGKRYKNGPHANLAKQILSKTTPSQ